MDSDGDDGAGCCFVIMKHVWNVMSYVLKPRVQTLMDVVLNSFCVSIFIFSLTRARMRRADEFAFCGEKV